MYVISANSGKGGVGKTSLCVWMAAWLERISKGKNKILIIDLDHQPAATKYMHGNPMLFNKYSKEYIGNNICDVLEGKISVKDAILEKEVKTFSRKGHIDYIFGSKDCNLKYLESKGVNISSAIYEVIKEAESLNYDFVIIDCHPDITILEDSAIAVSDICIIPTIPEIIELSGMTDMMSHCAQIPNARNKRVEAIVLNRCENKMVHKAIMRECQAFVDNPNFNGYFFKNVIESCTYCSQAVNKDLLLPFFKPQCKTSQCVKSVVEELLLLLEKEAEDQE